MQERRIRRSTERGAALSYQLEASAARTGADFMLLADGDGLLLATSQPSTQVADEVAARLACLALCDESVGELWREDRTVAALAFTAFGQRFIVGLGGASLDAGALPEIRRAIEGAKRILS